MLPAVVFSSARFPRRKDGPSLRRVSHPRGFPDIRPRRCLGASRPRLGPRPHCRCGHRLRLRATAAIGSTPAGARDNPPRGSHEFRRPLHVSDGSGRLVRARSHPPWLPARRARGHRRERWSYPHVRRQDDGGGAQSAGNGDDRCRRSRLGHPRAVFSWPRERRRCARPGYQRARDDSGQDCRRERDSDRTSRKRHEYSVADAHVDQQEHVPACCGGWRHPVGVVRRGERRSPIDGHRERGSGEGCRGRVAVRIACGLGRDPDPHAPWYGAGRGHDQVHDSYRVRKQRTRTQGELGAAALVPVERARRVSERCRPGRSARTAGSRPNLCTLSG